jgi:hypothetical protein
LTQDLHETFSGDSQVYGRVLDAIDADLLLAATKAEMNRRHAGLAHILEELRRKSITFPGFGDNLPAQVLSQLRQSTPRPHGEGG